MYDSWFRAHPQPGNIIIVNKGTPGLTNLVSDPVDFCIAQDMVAIRADVRRVYPHYLFAFLRSSAFLQQVEATTVGTTIPHLKKGDFDKLDIPLPERRTQEFIGEMYLAFSRRAALNRRTNQTLEAMAQALFKSWFVDFDPVRAKAQGRQPYGMDAETAALFPSTFVMTEGGDVPVGWRLARVADASLMNQRQLTSTNELPELEYIEISGVVKGEVRERSRFQRGTEPSRARRRPSHGDTVISTVRPERASYFLAISPPDNLVVSTGFAVLTPLGVPWSFLFTALTCRDVFETLGHLADGGAYPAVRPEVISNLPLVLPAQPVLERFHSLASQLLEETEVNRRQMDTLGALRDLLLPKLLSGELRVKNAETTIAAVV